MAAALSASEAARAWFEIQSSELALQKSKNQGIRNFAERMIKDHGQSSKELTKLVQSANLNLAPPTELDQEHAMLLRDLRQLTGEHFDRSYLRLQVSGHHQALVLHDNYIRTGSNPQLKAFARKVVDVVQSRVYMLKQMGQT
jgi:putative membrane protein